MIKLKNVTRKYVMGNQEIYAVKNLDLEIAEGDYVAIMGPSGSGKSSLMNILGLLDLPDSGDFYVNGVDTSKLNDQEISLLRRNTIGFIFQQFNLLTKLNAKENILLPNFYSKLKIKDGLVDELLKKVGLSHRSDHFPHELSGGQQQRVAIARSLINSPAVILADEPTGNLDSQSEQDILKILDDLNAQGITVIVVTHEDEVGERARRVIRMRDGVIQSDVRQKEIPKIDQRENAESLKEYATVSTFSMVKEYFSQGIRNLMINKIRSMLSILGILIGVSSVIAMMAFGRGAEENIKKQLAALGSNLLVVRTNSISGAPARKSQTFVPTKEVGVKQVASAPENKVSFSVEDSIVAKEQISNVIRASGLIESKVQVSFGNKNKTTDLQGVGPEFVDMHNLTPDIGRFFSIDENEVSERVVVLGMRIAEDFFPGINPIGEYIKINRQNFRVVGVLPMKGTMGQMDLDDRVIIPILTAQSRLLGVTSVDAVEVEVDNEINFKSVERDILNLMYQRHQISFSQRGEAFKVQNMSDVQKAMKKSSKTMSVLLMSIAAISLLVGGIGIMNIMLVSVTERTKEIGIRKSIGAMNTDILLQFLTETIVISSFGGILGIIFGVGVSSFLKYVANYNTVVGSDSIFISFLFSMGIGLVFGILPAKKASELKPIDALRSSM